MVTRISGINSGLDIDKMISDLMKAERMPLDKLKQKQTTLTWQTDLYREINTKLASLKNTVDNMRLTGDWKLMKTSSSNESAVTVTANSNASGINHSIEVMKLAQGATASSSEGITLSTLHAAGAASTTITSGVNDQFQVTLGGATKTIKLTASDYDADSLSEMVQSRINAAFGANKITVSQSDGELSFEAVGTSGYQPQIILRSVTGNTGLSDLGFSSGQSNKINGSLQLGAISSQFQTPLEDGSFKINGIEISYSSTDTLNSIMSRVNSSFAGVNMSYDEVADRLVFTTKETGVTAQIKLENGESGNFLDAFNLVPGTVTGTDAEVKIDGVLSYRSSNTFTTGDVTYTLKQETTSAVTVGVFQDVDKMVETIKDFVTKYNDTVDLLNKRIKETKFRSFLPLTEDQKKAMSEDEVKLWEEKAKSGLLGNDYILKSVNSDLRLMLSKSVAGAGSDYNAFYKIGLDTMAYNAGSPQDSGKLVLDEAALRKAITADASSVIATFSSQPDGIAQQMYSRLNTAITEISKKAGSAGTQVDSVTTQLGDKIHDLNRNIVDFEAKMTQKEDYYYKLFAAMDAAVGKSNAQLSWMMQAFG